MEQQMKNSFQSFEVIFNFSTFYCNINKNDFSANCVIESDKVEQVMKSVDRGDFCKSKSNPFSDAPQGIGHSVTISAPHMVRQKLSFKITLFEIFNFCPKIHDMIFREKLVKMLRFCTF